MATAEALNFDTLGSGYGVAGGKAVGWSKTVQPIHGSEVAFWRSAGSRFASVVRAIRDLPSTKVGVGGA